MKITSKDIAMLAGVSRGTVDRALNDRGQIAPDVKAKILKIAKEHGYVKNVMASSLAKTKTWNIAVVLPDPELDEFWGAPLKGIQSVEPELRNHGLDLQFSLFDIRNSQSYVEAMEGAIGQRPDAIITAPLYLNEALQFHHIAQQNNIPLISINSELKNQAIPYFGQNSYEAGRLAGQLFHLSGKKKGEILAVTLGHHSVNAIHIENKTRGLRDYCQESNSSIRITEYTIENFREPIVIQRASQEILENYPSISGILFTNSRAHYFADYSDLFREIQSDIVTIGFDLVPKNIELLKNGKIKFLLNQNPKRQGELSAQALMNYFVHKEEIPISNYLPIDIVVRENYLNYLKI